VLAHNQPPLQATSHGRLQHHDQAPLQAWTQGPERGLQGLCAEQLAAHTVRPVGHQDCGQTVAQPPSQLLHHIHVERIELGALAASTCLMGAGLGVSHMMQQAEARRYFLLFL
jgi:hypothetical protein